ncbi:MAG: hypothetical protein NC124_11750 [Clostridium sp.]|nr:hypothetical protein [Clostridium sp.]
MKTDIKKFLMCFSLVMMMGLMCGCGNGERVKTMEEQALGQKEKAEDVVDEINTQTNQLQQDADSIGEE